MESAKGATDLNSLIVMKDVKAIHVNLADGQTKTRVGNLVKGGHDNDTNISWDWINLDGKWQIKARREL